MPEKFDRCVKRLRDQGYSLDKSFAICQVSVNKKGREGKSEEKSESKSPAKGLKSGKSDVEHD